MDCEKFDRVVLDLLYEELDELTQAAALRHMDHCTRCHRIGAGLRATREVGALPMVAPPHSLQARILEVERQATSGLPWTSRLGRWISITASYAMRPQLGMAALLLLMIGGSLLLLRGSPGEPKATARGEAEPEHVPPPPPPALLAEPVAVPGSEEPPPVLEEQKEAQREDASERKSASGGALPGTELAGAAGSAAASQADSAVERPSFEAALRDFEARRYAAASTQFEQIAKIGGPDAALAALRSAEARRWSTGCGTAASRFDDVTARFGATHPAIAQHATWQAGECYRALGQTEQARQRYQALLTSGTYRARAENALDSLAPSGSTADAGATTAPREEQSPP